MTVGRHAEGLEFSAGAGGKFSLRLNQNFAVIAENRLERRSGDRLWHRPAGKGQAKGFKVGEVEGHEDVDGTTETQRHGGTEGTKGRRVLGGA